MRAAFSGRVVGVLVAGLLSFSVPPVLAVDPEVTKERNANRLARVSCHAYIDSMVIQLQPTIQDQTIGQDIESDEMRAGLMNLAGADTATDEAIERVVNSVNHRALQDPMRDAMRRHRDTDERLSRQDFSSFQSSCEQIVRADFMSSMQPDQQRVNQKEDGPTSRSDFRNLIMNQARDGQAADLEQARQRLQSGQQRRSRQRAPARQQRAPARQQRDSGESSGGFQISPSTGGRR